MVDLEQISFLEDGVGLDAGLLHGHLRLIDTQEHSS